jgi:gluconokinase
MEPYVIGIDLGTGSAKALAMNSSGKILDNAHVAYPILEPQPGYQEQNPELIWQAFVKCISRITTKMQSSPRAISLSSAMHSVIPIDNNDRPLMNMIIWADNRSASIARSIHQTPTGKDIYEETGTPIHAMTPLCKIQWLRTHAVDIFKATAKFISIKEFVWFQLFKKYEADYSIASATGLMDIDKLSWYEPSLATVGISARQLSTLVNTSHQRRCADDSLHQEMGITSDTTFLIGASDGCLANIGSFATEEGDMALTIGTSGAVRVTRTKPMLNFKAMTFNYRLDESTYICGGPINNGGIALKWYAEKLLGKKLETVSDYASLLQALQNTRPGADGLIFLPYVLGERAPIWNSEASGVFFGMRTHHEQSHFTRAVIEGISTSLYDIAHNMIETGLDIKQINVSGGFVHSEEWLQLLADMFGKKVCLINIADASAIGAAFLAMKHLGMISSYQELKPQQVREFLPNESNMSSYRELFLRYRNLYEAVAGEMI